MKEAAEYLREFTEQEVNCKVEYNMTGNGILKAMEAYAKEYAVACLQKASEKAEIMSVFDYDEIEGIGEWRKVIDKRSIHTNNNLI